jgi:HD-GYP domain-containing protein (c-di-GMP phosphodiesterase class II)
MTKSDVILDSDKLISMSVNEIRTFYKKAILNKYIEEKAWSNKTDANIAKEIGISKSTINRYKIELGLTPTRKPTKISAEKRQAMNAKRMKSKKMKDMYEKELKAVMETEYSSKEDFEREYNRVIKTYITGDDEESITPEPVPNSKWKQKNNTATKGGAINEAGANEASAVASAVDTAREEARRLLYASKI